MILPIWGIQESQNQITILSAVSETKTNVWYCLHAEPKKWNKSTYLQNRNKQTHIYIENKLTVTKEEGRIKLDYGINRYIPLYIKKIIRIYCLAQGITFSIIIYNRKESEKYLCTHTYNCASEANTVL